MKNINLAALLLVAVVLFGASTAQAQPGLIFADGFEEGNTSAWSATVPPPPSPGVVLTPISRSARSISPTQAEYEFRWEIWAQSLSFFEKTMMRGFPGSENGFWVLIETDDPSGSVHSGGTVSFQIGTLCPCGQDTTTHFGVGPGEREFILFLRFDDSGPSGSRRARFTGVSWDGDGGDTNGDNVLPANGSGFVTAPVQVGGGQTFTFPPPYLLAQEFYETDGQGRLWYFVTGVLE